MAGHTIGTITGRRSTVANPDTSSVVVLPGETLLVLLIKTTGATDRAGGAPTWGEFAFTQRNIAQKDVTSPEAGCEVWDIVNPLTGTRTLTIPNTAGANLFVTVVRFQATPGGHSRVSNSNGGHNTSANPTPGAITVVDTGEVVVAITAGGWTTWNPSAQAGTVLANADDGVHGGGEQYKLNPAIGSFDCNWTFGTSDDWGAVVAAYEDVPPTVLENYKADFKASSAGILSIGALG